MTRTPDPLRPRITPLHVGLLLAASAAGCGPPKYADLKAFLLEHEHGDVASSRYRIEPPDVISIASPTAPELDGVSQTVTAEGNVSLKLLGEVKISTLTPTETAAKLELLLKTYYVDPVVHVRVTGFRSKRLYVLGEVRNSGPKPFTGRDTLLSVLAASQPTFIAWEAQVHVIRPSPDSNERHDIIVDVDKIMKEGDLKANFLLQEGDIVYVPATPLGWLGLRIREVLFPFSPALEAYQTPSDFLRANDTYEDRYGADE